MRYRSRQSVPPGRIQLGLRTWAPSNPSRKESTERLRLIRRTDELFDIIVDYPESMAALEDLKVRGLDRLRPDLQECLFKVDHRSLLVEKLNAA